MEFKRVQESKWRSEFGNLFVKRIHLHLNLLPQLLKIEIIKCDNLEMEFDVIGINVAFVNAIRRVLLAEVSTFERMRFTGVASDLMRKAFSPFQVPSMAIEKVHVYNNTSLLQDEVLAHRLGLIPLKADPRAFSFKKSGTFRSFGFAATVLLYG